MVKSNTLVDQMVGLQNKTATKELNIEALVESLSEEEAGKARTCFKFLIERRFRAVRDEKGNGDCAELLKVLNWDAPKELFEQIRDVALEELARKADAKSIVKAKYRQRYAANGGHCGDFVAKWFATAISEGFTLEKIAEQNGLNLSTEVKGQNPGQKRMNLGAMLRRRASQFQTITVGNNSGSLALKSD